MKDKIYKVACHTDNVGQGTIFVAINGTKENGNNYIPVALSKGAKKIFVEIGSQLDSNIISQIESYGAELKFVENARKSLAEISAQEYNYPAKKLKVIGVTGTKGKTTTVFLTANILKTAGYRVALTSSVKNIILDEEEISKFATPLPDYIHNFLSKCVEVGVEYVVMELAAQAFSMFRIYGIELEAAVFTNFSQEHAEFYSNQEEYFSAKLKIIEHLKSGSPLIINSDDNKVASLKNIYNNCFDFSLNSNSCAKILAQILKSELSGVEFEVNNKNKITSPLVGQFNVQNLLAAASVCLNLGLSWDQIKNGCAKFSRVPGRLEKIILSNGATAFVDYAHNAASFKAVLSALRPFSKRMIVLFGAGGDRDPSRRPVMGQIASEIADIVILSTDNPRSEDPQKINQQIEMGISAQNLGKVYKELDREKAIKLAYGFSDKDTTIVLLGKGVNEYQIVGNNTYYFSETKILQNL